MDIINNILAKREAEAAHVQPVESEAKVEVTFPFTASVKKVINERNLSAKNSINNTSIDKDIDTRSIDRRSPSAKSPTNVKLNQQPQQADSGFNESTDTTLVTPPNGKINFESEKTMNSKRAQKMPEVVTK